MKGTEWEGEHLGSLPHCAGPCNQGRKLCPCPEACRLQLTDEAANRRIERGIYAVCAVLLVLAVLVVAMQ